jgi:hypothetical protein
MQCVQVSVDEGAATLTGLEDSWTERNAASDNADARECG